MKGKGSVDDISFLLSFGSKAKQAKEEERGGIKDFSDLFQVTKALGLGVGVKFSSNWASLDYPARAFKIVS